MANDVLVVNDWETAYNNEFSRAGGTRPLVLSYSSSPPFEVIGSDKPLSEPPTGVVTGDGSCFRQIEFVGILKGLKTGPRPEMGGLHAFTAFQEDVPLQMYVFPVNVNAKLADVFVKYLVIPKNRRYQTAEIAQNREQWLKDWTDTVLR